MVLLREICMMLVPDEKEMKQLLIIRGNEQNELQSTTLGTCMHATVSNDCRELLW